MTKDSEATPKPGTSPSGDGWQPIETAPKDGTVVLLAAHDIHGHSDPGGPRRVVRSAYWHDGVLGNRGDWSSSSFTTHFPPTHWMPLPTPPAQDTQRSEATNGDHHDEG